MSPRIANLARSLRPQVIFFSWIIFFVVLTTHAGFNLWAVLSGLVWFVAVYGIVVVHNDLSDIEIDKANNRHDIPLVNGEVAQKDLRNLTIGLSGVATLCSLVLGLDSLIVMIVYILLGWLYSGPANLKGRGVFAIIILGFCYGCVPIWLGIVASGASIGAHTIWLTVSSFIFASGIVLLKDFKDIKGDRLGGKKTLLVMYGPGVIRRLMQLFTTSAYLVVITLWSTNDNWIGAGIGMLFLICNLGLLQDGRIAAISRIRVRIGHSARTLFYLYALTSYVIWVVTLMR